MKLEEYFSHIRYECGQVELKNKSIIHGHGLDIGEFLSKQVTSHVQKLSDLSFQESALTDIKGRLVASFILIKESNNSFYIIVEESFKNETYDRLEMFHISEDLTFEFVDKKIFLSYHHAKNNENNYQGMLYNRKGFISFFELPEIPFYEEDLFNQFIFISGSPTIGKEITPGELITNSFLTEVAIDFKKGCYPGQETISKIHNNKGASFFPVCLIGEKEIKEETLRVDDKKIGELKKALKINEYYYHYVSINRSNRIFDKKILINDEVYTVKYFPLLDNSPEKIAIELYDEAVSYFHNNENEKAIELLKKSIAFNPSFSDAYESLGVIYGRDRRFEEAIDIMKQLSEVDQTSVMAHTNLSMYYMQLGDKETAEKHKAEATFKQFEVLGNEAQKKKKIEEEKKQSEVEKKRRESMFLQVLEIDEDDALANFGMGELCLERKEFSKAILHLTKSITVDKKYSVAYLALGKSYLENNEKSEAKEVLIKGIDIAVNNGDLMPANEMQSILNNL